MKLVAACLVAGLFGFSALAQTKPDFSGTWILDKGRSKLEIPVPDSTTFVIEHAEPSFRLTRTHVAKGKPDTFSIALTTDGKEIVTKEPGEVVMSTCRWDANALHFDSRIARGSLEATNLVTYTLSADAKTLTAFERFTGPKLKYVNTWVFARQ